MLLPLSRAPWRSIVLFQLYDRTLGKNGRFFATVEAPCIERLFLLEWSASGYEIEWQVPPFHAAVWISKSKKPSQTRSTSRMELTDTRDEGLLHSPWQFQAGRASFAQGRSVPCEHRPWLYCYCFWIGIIAIASDRTICRCCCRSRTSSNIIRQILLRVRERTPWAN
jgi:hypothetical protein